VHTNDPPLQQQQNRDGHIEPAPPTPIQSTVTFPIDSSSPEETESEDEASTPPILRLLRAQTGLEQTMQLLQPITTPTPIGTPFNITSPTPDQKLKNLKEKLDRFASTLSEHKTSALDSAAYDDDGYSVDDGYETPGGGWGSYADVQHSFAQEKQLSSLVIAKLAKLRAADNDDLSDAEEEPAPPHQHPPFQIPCLGQDVWYQPHDTPSDTDEEPVADPHNYQLHKYDKNHWFPTDRPYDPRYDTSSDQWDCDLYHDLRDSQLEVAEYIA
jgi:hypothetical protein